ncbi:uncharacterized protein LOC144596432 isoform X2 [Rhinoraja longicauda]
MDMLEELKCSICHSTFCSPVTTACGHSFCSTCLKDHWGRQTCPSCPLCRHHYPERPQLSKSVTLNLLCERLQTERGKADLCPLPGSQPQGSTALTDHLCSIEDEETRGRVHLELQRVESQLRATWEAEAVLAERADSLQESVWRARVELCRTLREVGRRLDGAVAEEGELMEQRRARLQERRMELRALLSQDGAALQQGWQRLEPCPDGLLLPTGQTDICTALTSLQQAVTTAAQQLQAQLCGNSTHAADQADQTHDLDGQMPRLDGQVPGPNGQTPRTDTQTAGPDGQMAGPDGQMAGPDGQTAGPDNQTAGPDGQTAGPDGQTAGPDSQTAGPDNQTAGPDGQMAGPDSQTAGPDNQTAGPDSQVAGPDGQTAGLDNQTLGVDNARVSDIFHPVARVRTAGEAETLSGHMDPTPGTGWTAVSFDESTASGELRVSEQGALASNVWPENQERAEGCGRFQRLCQVLGMPELGGRHYWEVAVTGQPVMVGLAHSGMDRRRRDNASLLGHNPSSWCLELSQGKAVPWHDKQPAGTLPAPHSHIGLLLDLPQHTLAFYSLGPVPTLLHRFPGPFPPTLLPAFYINRGASIRILPPPTGSRGQWA